MTETERGSRPAGAGLSPPMWVTALLYGLVATLAVCIPAWPGHMSYDPLFAYKESISGIEILTWPPLHAYFFWLSRHLGAGAGGVFAAQTFLLFASAAIIASVLLARRALAWAAMAVFAILFVAVPPMLGVLMSQWRDVATGGLALAAIAAWLVAGYRRAPGFIVVMALMLGLCVALRYNSFPLFGLLVPMMVWRPYVTPGSTARLRLFTAASMVIALALAAASMTWRLPDFKSPPRANSVAGTQLFDLIGISACTGHDYLPLSASNGWPLTTEQLRLVYDPRHLNRAFREIPGVPHMEAPSDPAWIQKTWLEVVPKEFDCYLAHRTTVLLEQMGMAKGEVFYPVHGDIDQNPYGLKLAHPRANSVMTTYVRVHSPSNWRRPVWLYVIATLLVAALAVRRDRWILLEVATLAGAYANVALLFLIGPAADARYIFTSNLLCAVLIAVGLVRLAAPRQAASPS
jgi:hypothetical protein